MAALAVLLLAAACESAEPQRTTLATVVRDQERYEGELLLLAGVVRAFEDVDGTRYFVLEDEAANRALLRPAAEMEDFVGVTACVEGRYSFSESTGRVIEVESIQTVGRGGCPP